MQGYMRKNKNIAKYVSLLLWTENGVVTESRLRNDVVCTRDVHGGAAATATAVAVNFSRLSSRCGAAAVSF
jgi:hypothetical protein